MKAFGKKDRRIFKLVLVCESIPVSPLPTEQLELKSNKTQELPS